jgi:mannitol/fructose-specific phosphotransferase system IIA component (Ntr-type)
VRAETKKQFSHQEIAHLLEIDEITLQELLNKVNNVSLIPGPGSSYNKDDIVKWVELLIEKHPEIVASFLVNKSKSGTSPVYEYLHSNHIILNLGAQKAEKAIEEIISISERTNLIKNQDELLKLVLARENFCSTAVGGGIAFPHPILTTFEVVKTTLIVVGISKNGIDFNFFDGRLVNIVVLMAVPNTRMHLQILSRLANIFLSDKVKNDILNSSCEKDVIEIIRGKETELF